MLVTMFSLTDYLGEKRTEIDAAIDAALPPESTRPGVLHSAMRYSVLSGGKRLRPILALAAAEAVGGEPAAAMHVAVAVELLHSYTLIHDDLPAMDDDDERRGRPTCHIKFGEANAILAGDALQTLAFQVVAAVPAPAPYSPTQMVTELAVAVGHAGVVGGQVEDIAHDGQAIDRATIEFIHQHKTGDLFQAAIRMGAIAAGSDSAQLDALTEYARHIGTAFQIVDDLLDADTDNSGTSQDHDRSCIGLYGLSGARQKADEMTAAAVAATQSLGDSAHPLRAIALHMKGRTH